MKDIFKKAFLIAAISFSFLSMQVSALPVSGAQELTTETTTTVQQQSTPDSTLPIVLVVGAIILIAVLAIAYSAFSDKTANSTVRSTTTTVE